MSHEELNIDIKTERSGESIIFRLRGALDIATSPTIRAALLEEVTEHRHKVVVDLTQLNFLDSTGLGALIGAQRRALERGGEHLRLVVTEGPISRLLNITGLMEVFAVYPSVETALNGENRVPATL